MRLLSRWRVAAITVTVQITSVTVRWIKANTDKPEAMSALHPKADMCGATAISAKGQKRTSGQLNTTSEVLPERRRQFGSETLMTKG